MTALLADIADVAADLCDPIQHTERYEVWDRHRNKKIRTHTVELPGLLTQLYESVIPSSSATGPGARTVAGSRPPLALEALSRHAAITIAAADWAWRLRVDLRDTPESTIRALVGAAAGLPERHPDPKEPDQHDLLADLRRWRTWCQTLTGWRTIWAPRAPCPIDGCGMVRIRVDLGDQRATCTACGATWGNGGDGSLGVLAEYIRSLDRVAS